MSIRQDYSESKHTEQFLSFVVKLCSRRRCSDGNQNRLFVQPIIEYFRVDLLDKEVVIDSTNDGGKQQSRSKNAEECR